MIFSITNDIFLNLKFFTQYMNLETLLLVIPALGVLALYLHGGKRKCLQKALKNGQIAASIQEVLCFS